MYKKQLTFEKIVCLLAVIAGAAVFIYSLGIMTDLYDCLYSTMMNPNNLTQTDVPGSIVYYDMQDFNGLLTKAGIVLILLGCLLFITNTHVRRKYYIGNYVATALNVIAGIGVSVWAHLQIEAYKAQFLQVDFEALKKHAELWKTAYTESTVWFDLHYGVFALVIISAVLLVVNMIWKIRLMKEEAQLLAAGKENGK